MIGLNFTDCVYDIVLGRVALGDVEYIVTGTCYESKEDWLSVTGQHSDEFREIALRLIEDGRVIQPRLESGLSPDSSKGNWVTDSSKIEYFQDRNLRQVREMEARWERENATLH